MLSPLRSGYALPTRREHHGDTNRQRLHLSDADSCPNKPGHRSPSAQHQIRFSKFKEIPSGNFSAAFETLAQTFPQGGLSEGSWELESSAERELRSKITHGRKTFKEVYGSPLYGIKTGLNKAFVIDASVRNDLMIADPRSGQLIKPFVEGKDLKRWASEPRGLSIIYIPRNTVEIDSYPAIKDHLLPFKSALEERATVQRWFELQQAQAAYVERMISPKVIWKDIASSPSFSFDTSGVYPDCTCFFAPSDDPVLCALLNSKVAWYQISALTTIARGGFFRLKTQYVESVCLPEMDATERQAIAELAGLVYADAEERRARRQAVRDRIPDLCPPGRRAKLTDKLQDWWTCADLTVFRAEVRKAFKVDIPLSERSDWQALLARETEAVHRLSVNIARRETAIDAIVYRLFKLSDKEVKILERNLLERLGHDVVSQ